MREQVLRPPEGEGGSRVCDQKRWESGKGRGKEGAPKMIALGFFDIGGRGLRGWAGSRGVGGRRTEEERERLVDQGRFVGGERDDVNLSETEPVAIRGPSADACRLSPDASSRSVRGNGH